jgi:hypothetical protein
LIEPVGVWSGRVERRGAVEQRLPADQLVQLLLVLLWSSNWRLASPVDLGAQFGVRSSYFASRLPRDQAGQQIVQRRSSSPFRSTAV